MMTLRELTMAFQTARECIVPGGVFAFDMNMEGKYAERWEGMFTVEGADYRCHINATTDMRRKRAFFEAAIEDDIHRNRPLTIRFTQTWYPAPTIKRELKKVGFRVCGQYVLVGGSKPGSAPDRILFVCRSS